MSEQQLTDELILQLLREVSAELEPTTPMITLVLVGGALLALHGLRSATRDVDTVSAMNTELTHAVATVARHHDLSPTWLNASSRPFAPAGLTESRCDLLLDTAWLRVLGAPLPSVFLMKIHASRMTDRDDLRTLWAQRPFPSLDAAYRCAYPNDLDEHLDTHVAAVLGEQSDPIGRRDGAGG